jgi:hypothetical protein
MPEKTISKSTRMTEVDSIPTSANPRKGRKGRTSVVTAEKKGKELVRSSETLESKLRERITHCVDRVYGLGAGGYVKDSLREQGDTIRDVLKLVAPQPGRSICADCASLHTGRCPLTPVLRRYDIVVWVDECDQLMSRKGVKV